MPQRLTLPPLGASEERRRWAEAIADLHYFCGLISEHAPYLIPGEHVDGFRAAWGKSSSSFEKVVQALTNSTPEGETISEEALSHAKLDGSIGAQKRSILAQLRDVFLGYFMSEPRSEEKVRLAAEAGARHADMGAVALDSLGACVSHLPVVGAACKVAEEGLLTAKQLLEMRGRRGY